MNTISQRELRNNSAEVMRKVAQGMSFRITRHGTPIAKVGPLEQRPGDDLVLREGTGEMVFATGLSSRESTDDALAELRDDR